LYSSESSQIKKEWETTRNAHKTMRTKPQERDHVGDLEPNVHIKMGPLKLTVCEGLDLNQLTQQQAYMKSIMKLLIP
jgi:hypothetical protein